MNACFRTHSRSGINCCLSISALKRMLIQIRPQSHQRQLLSLENMKKIRGGRRKGEGGGGERASPSSPKLVYSCTLEILRLVKILTQWILLFEPVNLADNLQIGNKETGQAGKPMVWAHCRNLGNTEQHYLLTACAFSSGSHSRATWLCLLVCQAQSPL